MRQEDLIKLENKYRRAADMLASTDMPELAHTRNVLNDLGLLNDVRELIAEVRRLSVLITTAKDLLSGD